MEGVVIAVCSVDRLALPGITHILGTEPGMTVVSADLVQQADIALVVADEVDPTTLDLLTRVARSSSARIVLVTDQLDERNLTDLARCRVVSVLARDAATAAGLAGAIDGALRFTLSPGELTTQLMNQLERVSGGLLRPKAARTSLLAPRERELLRLLAEGRDTAEIAGALSYSERTVKNIVHGLLNRLQLRNRAHAVAFAMRAGVL